MKPIKFFCVTDKKVNFLNKNNHYLCWVGKEDSPENYLRCDIGDNIYHKEKYYSELTFHYWYWKNLLDKDDKNDWIGFCQKRRYLINTEKTHLVNKSNLNDFLFDEAPSEWENYDVLICKPLNVSGVKKMKIIKRGFKNLIKDPSIIFNKKKQNLYLHFDMHHGYGNLKKAIDLLDEKNKDNFLNFMKNNNSFNPHIMFISKPDIIKEWFNNLFPWLKACEQKFEFKHLKGYDTGRLFAYLSERYLSYWFKKNYRFKEINWVQLDNF